MRSIRPIPAALVVPAVFAFLFAPARSAGPPDLVAKTEARTPEEERTAFHLPEGFVAELVASEPDIHKPLNIAFDDRGRLWVTDTLEYPFPALDGKTPRDGVKILSDFAPDGKARKIQTFATGLNIPIGLIPMPGGNEALVHAIPNIYRLTDTDGDGVADKKEPAYQSYGFRDTHGMTNAFTWGFDGWIYACHGFSNESNVKGKDGKPIVMQSGNTYRMKADGSHVEYFTHGQVNPFGLCFDPLGNAYTSDCHSRPIYQILRGACYPSFGKPDDGLGFGPEMCPHDHGSTGIAGIVYYAADHFPKQYQDRILIGNPVTSRINWDTIEWTGSTPKAIEQPDFLNSDDPWFRPVDLELGPDGALYVADFYNRIIGHYEVPLTHPGRDRERGRIWRICYRGKEGKPLQPIAGFGERANVRQLQYGLLSPNLTVRMQAANRWLMQGVAFSDESVLQMIQANAKDEKENLSHVHFLWLAMRAGKLSEGTLTQAMAAKDRGLRVHAFKVLAEWLKPSEQLAGQARTALKDADPFVRRAAAEALGQHPGVANIKPLLTLRAATPAGDTHLVHVVRMALRDQFAGASAWDQIETLSDRERADVADVLPGVHSKESAQALLKYLESGKASHDSLPRYVKHVARFGEKGSEKALLAVLTQNRQAPPSTAIDLLRAYEQGLQERGVGLDEDARKYAETLVDRLLSSRNDGEVATGINVAGSFRLGGTLKRLEQFASNPKSNEGRRAEALAAVESIDPPAAEPILAKVLVDASSPIGLRERAAALLAQGGRPGATAALAGALPTVPARLQSAIAAGLAVRKESAQALLTAVATGKASARLLQEPRVAGPLGNAGVPDLSKKLAELLKGMPPADARINALIATRRAGFATAKADAAPGAKLFENQCGNCHMLGGKGGRVGPQLDGIGVRGPDRLLEDILDPSRNVDQTFRTTTLALKDGRVVSGLLLREEGAVVVLADAQGKEVRVPSSEVEERSIAPVSPMPANFAEQIPEADFYRLLAYLLTQRPAQ